MTHITFDRSKHGHISHLHGVHVISHHCQTLPLTIIAAMVVPTEVRQQIDKLVADSQNGQVVSCCHKLIALLEEKGFLREQVLLPEQVAVHPRNRDGTGLHTGDVHSLVEDLVQVGFSAEKTGGVCVETHGDLSVVSFNDHLHSISNGMLAKPDPQKVRFASLAGSHTVAGMKAVLAGCRHAHGTESKLVMDGCFSFAQVERCDAAYARACKHGYPWKVISKEIGDVPGVCDLLQAGMNTHVAKSETEFQILKRIANAFQIKAGTTERVDWQSMKQSLLRTKPLCADSCPHIFRFLTRFMVEKEVQDTERRIKRSHYVKLQLGQQWWSNMEVEGKTAKGQVLQMRWAVIRAAYCHPTSLVAQDIRKLLSQANIQKTEKGQEFLNELRSLTKAQLNNEEQMQVEDVMHNFEDAMVFTCIEKKPNYPTNFAMVMEVHAQIAIDAIKDVSGKILTTKIRQFGSTATITDLDMMKEMGYVVGMSVRRKKDRLKAQIGSMHDTMVGLDCEDGQHIDVPCAAFLQGEWKQLKESSAQEDIAIEDYKPLLGIKSKQVAFEILKGQILEKLLELEETHMSVHDGLKLFFKPSKSVFARKAFKVHALVLVPSGKIEEYDPAKKYTSHIMLPDQNGMKVHIQSNIIGPKGDDFSKASMSPFWLVRVSSDPKEVNMELVTPGGKGNPFKLPILRNSKAIKAGDVLVRLAPEASHAPEVEEEASQKKRKTTKS
eukprot:Skav216074  [mRNA]  locus=scaffold1111:4020:6433:+ [translate_table: standard]